MERLLRWTRNLLLVVGLLLAAWLVLRLVWRVGEVRGAVVAGGEPVASAVVRVKATDYETRTDEDGRFTLAGFPSRFEIRVTAWADGYYVAGATARPWSREPTIELER